MVFITPDGTKTEASGTDIAGTFTSAGNYKVAYISDVQDADDIADDMVCMQTFAISCATDANCPASSLCLNTSFEADGVTPIP
jgi:hypothetical protein